MAPEHVDASRILRSKAVTIFAELTRQPTIAAMSQATKELAAYRQLPELKRIKLACAASFTFDALRPALDLQLLRSGFSPDINIAPFGQVEQQLLDGNSELSRAEPDVVIVAFRLRDAHPDLYDAYNSLAPDRVQELIDDWVSRLDGAIRSFRSRSAARILVQNCELPAVPSQGLADGLTSHSQMQAIRSANERLRTCAESISNAYVVDYDALVSRHGRSNWSDPRMNLFARIPVAPKYYWVMAGFYAAYIRSLYGLTRKVLCLDADNTLWGGVVGDVGPSGITVGHDYPGSAFIAVQKAALDLYHRGVLLCLNSKNDEANVLEVLERHPDMILRREHFAAMRINWDDKPGNLRSMAEELNLGLDSFVFVDDHPVECEMMRSALPQVMCVQLPAEPALYEETIRNLDCFDQLTITNEDRHRGRLYQAEAKRKELATVTLDLPAFYRQLEMVMTLSVDDAMHAGRAAQMTQRTNQFNMNTIRCSEDEIRSWMNDANYRVVTLSLADKFGDNGVIGLTVARVNPSSWHLHLFMMSCRVLGRTVEQNFVRWIARKAALDGARELTATYVATAKNKPFAEFYQSCGFMGPASDGQNWRLSLADAEKEIPDYITLVENDSRRDVHAHH